MARIVIIAAASAAVVASQVIAPLSASALTPPPPAPSAQHKPSAPSGPVADPALAPGKPVPWSAARAKPHPAPGPTVNAAALRAQALAGAAKPARTASYAVSPAFLAFLRTGLGMPMETSTTFTGVRSGSSLTVSLPAPERLRTSVPGAAMPAFTRSLLTINQHTGAATLTAPATTGSLKVTIPDVTSSTLAGLSGDVTARLPVLGQTVALSGALAYRAGASASVSLSGALPASADLQHGVAELAAGATVTAATAGGLRVAGTATLGPAGRQLSVGVSGAITGTDGWNLAVTSAGSTAPLAGLALSPKASGSVTSARGRVSYDVKGATARPWAAAPGVTVSGAVELGNGLPNGHLIPAPGLSGTQSWADVTGTVALASGVTTPGTAAINLATGQGLLTSAGRTPVTLATPDGTVIHDSAGFHGTLTVSPSGQVTASLPRQLSRWTAADLATPGTPATPSAAQPAGTAGATAHPAAKAAVAGQSAAAGASASYTLSGPVLNFITATLHIPLSSATLTGTLSGSTLTLSAAAPTSLPASVPSWLPSPSYVSTQVTIDEAANTVTLSTGTGTASGATATLSVTIANAATSDLSDGTDVTGSLTLGSPTQGVPFAGGSTAMLAFTLGYASGKPTASATGTLTSDAYFGDGLVRIASGDSVTMAIGSGIKLSGSADLNYNDETTTVTVNGMLADASNWSLAVSNANGPVWQPVTGLSVTPNFTGSIADNNGSVRFDLSAGPAAATWVSPDGNSKVSVDSLEFSNQAPGSGNPATLPPCAALADIGDGELWIGVSGTFSYLPASLDLSATGCFDLTGKSATIDTAATGDLTSQFGSNLPFTVTAVGLTAHVGGSYSLTGTASVAFGNVVPVTVGVQLTKAGITAGVGISDLASRLKNDKFSGSGALYVSTVRVPGFDPTTLGITGRPAFDLPAGLSVALNYTLPPTTQTAIRQLIPALGNRTIPGLTAGTSVQALATLSTGGFTLDFTVNLGAATSGLTIFNASNSALYLNQFDVKLALGAQNQIGVSGTGYLVLQHLASASPADCPTADCPTGISVTIGGSFNINSLSLSLGFNVSRWDNAFGVRQLDLQDVGGSLGLTLESGVPTPTLQVYADNITLPPSWSQALGVVNGASISFNVSLSMTQPVLAFKINNTAGVPALTPLAIDPAATAEQVNDFVVYSALFMLAPDGGTTVAGDTLSPGVSVVFDAKLDSVPVRVDATVDLSAPSVIASASVGAFTIGPVQTSNTMFYLNLSPTSVSLGISGDIAYNNDTFSVFVSFAVGTSMNNADISMAVTGGLPSYFYADVRLGGKVTGDSSGAGVTASGSAYLNMGTKWLGPVSFSFSWSGGLNWRDYTDSVTQVAQTFVNSGMGSDQVVSAMVQWGYDHYDTLNALSQIGDYSPLILSTLANAFGVSTTYFDIWTYTSAGEALVMEVKGNSQSLDASIDTWIWNRGYNQDWAFVASPTSGWYEIVNRGSGQCLTVENNSTTPTAPLVQWPCVGNASQLWYMGNIALATNYAISSYLDNQVAEVQGAYPLSGGTVDQYPWISRQNQIWWLTNSVN
jgi:hypothetical protein